MNDITQKKPESRQTTIKKCICMHCAKSEAHTLRFISILIVKDTCGQLTRTRSETGERAGNHVEQTGIYLSA